MMPTIKLINSKMLAELNTIFLLAEFKREELTATEIFMGGSKVKRGFCQIVLKRW